MPLFALKISTSLAVFALIISTAIGASVEMSPVSFREAIATGTIIFNIESKPTGAIIPVPVRLLGIKYPEKKELLLELSEVFQQRFAPEAFNDPNVHIKIYSPGSEFKANEEGILLGVIEIITKKKRADGSTITGSLNLAASLLATGAFLYDDSLEDTDERLHDLYTKGQEVGKKNGFGVWTNP